MYKRTFVSFLVSASVVAGPGLILAQSGPDAATCGARAEWVNCGEPLIVSRTMRPRLMLQLLTHVSRGCLNGRVDLTASYLDRDNNVLCTGTLRNLASSGRNVQDLTLELGPTVLRNFARWRNRPGERNEPVFEALACTSADGRANLLDSQLEGASEVVVTATLLPSSSGLDTAQCRIQIAP